MVHLGTGRWVGVATVRGVTLALLASPVSVAHIPGSPVAPQLLRRRSVQRNKRVRFRIWRRAWDIDYLQVRR